MSGAAPRLNPLATGDTQLAHTLVPGQMVDIAGGRVMEVVDVPDRLLAPLLGEGGATLEEIRRVSGASIEMIEMVKLKLGDAERRAIVTGVRTIVAHAVKMIADVLANPTVMVAQPVQATVETRVIEIPFNKAGLIIGRAGETIRDIMSKSGAHVQVSREATGEDEETRTVTIQGTAEQIESAAAHVNSKLNPDDWQLAVKAQNAMASGVELHLAKLPSRGQRAVKLSGEATAVETVAAFLRACDARAARRQKRRRPLAPQDAARRYYDRYYEEGGIAAAAEEQQREAEEGGGEAEHALPEGWQKGVTPDGRDYFYNVGTGATQWIRPNDY
ncbi:hypothetical protein EMIHUDRAFT_233069 [Emiliania huxleyi CCMP1516]|uniref:WW domain-containing protein n=2 Tax=Emiliania huxleyi TaxID=2903 RepID=A0A0D3JGA1_EMIH1|nr:hypothetical protein EMIHUDRAFT_240212 [Emiliania huxleyi CCMP1516]XP_005782798.1 hypothetical protein EMIHUDRAFT_233069 [Emiliania huxleyi CCMP1516]EOD22536.1 hypothetical protein EMIHUDRAFT_240212 [Emiliania huxleyi CCMP1516]EOD30369.1 hypothetical protein EMIHUDRAFT_233069 [Emiliania huxleyi CCMP1516]|eukprot:XP_005774965.1 hypothetical protein EMIHUDRAFT_240212 [Emiliania huxleyi CCMP1516]